MSTHDSTTDIQAKYQKLATEYAKLRAQVGVLKKGVLDEQAKCSQYFQYSGLMHVALIVRT